MGRRRQSNHDLPPRLHFKAGSYYYVTFQGGKRQWLNLGKDRPEALRRWAELEGQDAPVLTKRFDLIAARYQRDEFPRLAPRTQHDYERAIRNLSAVFGAMPIDTIKPPHLAEYLARRGQSSTVQANREIAVFSTIYNRAREWGYTTATNPCEGVRRHRERPRERYVTDTEYKAVWDKADQPTQDAMDLALLTGQREGDVLKMRDTDIQGGVLYVRQNKTRAALRILVTGQLAEVITRIQTRGGRKGPLLVQTEDGQPLTEDALRKRFSKARKAANVDFQYRDLRAKAATDRGDLAKAQKLLGHKNRSMTEDYVRARQGEMVEPLK